MAQKITKDQADELTARLEEWETQVQAEKAIETLANTAAQAKRQAWARLEKTLLGMVELETDGRGYILPEQHITIAGVVYHVRPHHSYAREGRLVDATEAVEIAEGGCE
jgi:hypothetical protein